MDCGWRGPMGPVLDRLRAGEEDPPCAECGGILKSATISFGQALVPRVIERAMVAAETPICCWRSARACRSIRSPPRCRRKGRRRRVVIVNAEPTPFDDVADAVLRGRIGDVLPAICKQN
jgi:NAD-dependent deacetylase